MKTVKNGAFYETVEARTNKEICALAAKAAGYTLDEMGWRTDRRNYLGEPTSWNPLSVMSDALELAIDVGISIDIWPDCVYAVLPRLDLPVRLLGIAPYCVSADKANRKAAVLRAVTVAAATLGAQMRKEVK